MESMELSLSLLEEGVVSKSCPRQMGWSGGIYMKMTESYNDDIEIRNAFLRRHSDEKARKRHAQHSLWFMPTNFSMNSVLTCTYRITLAKNGRCRHRRDVRIGTHGIVRCKGLVGENILLLAILRGCGCSVGGGHGRYRYRYRRVSVPSLPCAC
jgi:hypothetical protein